MLQLLKPTILTIVLTAFISCSSDENKNLDPTKPTTKTILIPKKISAIENYFNIEKYTVEFNYTDDFLIANFVLKNNNKQIHTKAEYEDGKLARFYNDTSDTNNVAILNYNNKNQLIGMDTPHLPTMIFSYNTNNQVIETNIDHLLVSKYTYDTTGNIEKAKMVVTVPGQTAIEKRKFTYDDKNPPFKYTNYSFELDVSELLSEINFIYKPTNNPLTEESDNGGEADNLYNYKYEYTYNEYDFPITIKKITNSGKVLEERTYEYEVHIINID